LCHLLKIAQHFQLSGQGRGLTLPGTSLEEEPRIFEQTLAYFLRAPQESRAQLGDLAVAQAGFGDRRSQAQATLTIGPGDRHQMAHRRMGGDGAFAHLLLDLRRKLAHQRQTP
jgi:hypothetical protein